MVLSEINVFQFRNYDTLKLTLDPGINIIFGKNAQGKTNLLESIYVLAMTKSHRSFIDNNLIQQGKTNAKIKGTLFENKIPTEMEIILGQKQKKIKIDQTEIKKVSDYISKMNIIIFYPEDLDLIKGSPSIRRRFLNLEISQLNSNYLNLYNEYNKILKMRNDYLKKINKGMDIDQSYFEILNKYFVEKATLIYQYRNQFITSLNEKSTSIFQNLSGLSDFHLQYKTSIDINGNTADIINKLFEKMKKIRSTEMKLGSTLIGPHRDDIEFYIGDENIKGFGSQGQQRMAVLAVKLAEISIFKEKTENVPILLLDDVFSELDEFKKNNLLSYIKDDIQTIITTTDLNNINESILKKSKLIEIEKGKIKKIQEEEQNGTK